MKRFQKIGAIGLCVLMAASVVVPITRAGAPAATPKAAAAARTPDAIMADMKSAQEEVMKVMPSPKQLADPAFRSGDGQKGIAPLKKMTALFGELQATIPDASAKEDCRVNKFHIMAYVAALGDKETLETLNSAAKGTGPDALSAKSSLALANWLDANNDAAGETKVLDDFTAVAKQNPESEEVADTLGVLASLSANNDVTKKVIDVVRTNMKGDAVKSLLSDLDSAQEQLALVGKPLAVEGRTSTGGKFTTAEYKGKVVMLDFWATWCGPCIGELPNVKQAYADFHNKGFEIVGVSCDTEDGVLNKFTKDNDMPWLQLREESQNEADRWHPVAKKFHVDGIPAMFLIDRNGVLRYVDAREDLHTKIAQLVAEPVKAADKK